MKCNIVIEKCHWHIGVDCYTSKDNREQKRWWCVYVNLIPCVAIMLQWGDQDDILGDELR